VVVDVADLTNYEVIGPERTEDLDVSSGLPGTLVRFGAGHTNGQLYAKLDSHEPKLALPFGTEAMVGAAGLVLGCGRGLLSQVHGLACDRVRAIEYVDATGTLRTADVRANTDMFWLARGGGGFFPGVVTSFTASAVLAPRSVSKRKCVFNPTDGDTASAVVSGWVRSLKDVSEPNRHMFTHITVDQPFVYVTGVVRKMHLCVCD
jgi:FAD/FMN-containing dehydrogenase